MSTVGIDLINAEIARLTALKVGLQTDLTANGVQVTALQATGTSITNQIAVIDDKIASLNADISRLNT